MISTLSATPNLIQAGLDRPTNTHCPNLRDLVQAGWAGLDVISADPLNVLFPEQSVRWTMGWVPDCSDLIVLLGIPNGELKANQRWQVILNGITVFDNDNPQTSDAFWVERILNQPKLNRLSVRQLLFGLYDSQLTDTVRLQRAQNLLQTLSALPLIWRGCRNSLIDELFHWPSPEPVLDLVKIQTLEEKTLLASMLLTLISQMEPSTPRQQRQENDQHTQQLFRALQRLQIRFLAYNNTLTHPDIREKWLSAYTTFHDLYQRFYNQGLFSTLAKPRIQQRPNAFSAA